MNKEYVYVIEQWSDSYKDWVPYRFDIYDLEEIEHIINLLEEVLPNEEFRPAQYTISEYQHTTLYW